jgi:hypothetical protein
MKTHPRACNCNGAIRLWCVDWLRCVCCDWFCCYLFHFKLYEDLTPKVECNRFLDSVTFSFWSLTTPTNRPNQQVRKRRKAEIPEAAASDDDFFANMKELLEQEEHMDVVFQLYANNVSMANNPTKRRNSQKQPQVPPQHNIKAENEESTTMEMETSNSNNVVNGAAKGDTVTVEVRAHKAVLMARTEHFRNMFSGEEGPQPVPSASLEDDEEDEEEMEDEDVVQEEEEEEEDEEETKSPHVYSHKKKTTKRSTSTVTTSSTTVANMEDHCSSAEQQLTLVQVDPEFTEHHIRLTLEFIYTNRLVDIRDIATDDLLALLKLSHLWLLRDLKRLVELELIRSHISSDTVARLYGAADNCAGKRLKDAAIKFIMANLKALTSNVQFKEEMKNFPELCIPVLKAAADLIPDGPVHKKQRTDLATGTPSSAIAAFRSSPVPDSDQ